MEFDEKEARILLEIYGAGGAARWSKLKKKLVDTGVMSETTLYLKLKGLKEKDRAFVERKLLDDELHWTLTPKGVYTTLKEWSEREVGTNEFKKELEKWSQARGFSVKIEELHPEAWWDLVKEIIDHLKIMQHLRDQSEEDFMKNVRSYVDQIKSVTADLWPGLLHELTLDLAYMIVFTLVYRAFLPSPLSLEDIKKMKDIIGSVAEPLSKRWQDLIETSLLNNFRWLEALVVLNEAVKNGKVESPAPGTPVEEIIKKLQERQLLAIEED